MMTQLQKWREPAIRVTLLPGDTNAHGTIFGGVILSYIDIAGAAAAHRLGIPRVVTVAMNAVQFHEPVFVGDVVSFFATPVKIGRTSITVKVRVEAERIPATLEGDLLPPVKVTEAEVVYVAVDPQRKPVSILHLQQPVTELVARLTADALRHSSDD